MRGVSSILHRIERPAGIVLAGGLLAAAINFSLAQNPSASVLEGFDLHTDPVKKELRVTLRPATGGAAPVVSTEQKGKQLNVTLNNTQLSQQLIDDGLPVVIDNHNKLIGRAVPVSGSNQARIVIPNLPDEQYKVIVMQSAPGQASRVLSQTAVNTGRSRPAPAASLAASAPAKTATPRPSAIALKPAANADAMPEIRTRYATPAASIAAERPRVAQAQDLPDIRLSKSTGTLQPRPRPAVQAITLDEAPMALRSKSPEASPERSDRTRLALDSAPDAGTPVTMLSIQDGNAPLRLRPNAGVTTSGAITYVPHFGNASAGASNRRQGLWNPTVVSNANGRLPEVLSPGANGARNWSSASQAPERIQSERIQSERIQPERIQTVSIADSLRPPQQPAYPAPSQAAPANDPLWYLHQLPPAYPAAAPGNLPLEAVPDLNQAMASAAPSGNPQLSPAPTGGEASAAAAGNPLASVQAGIAGLPLWVSLILALFFGGVGLFCLLGAVVLSQQVWERLREPAARDRDDAGVTTAPARSPLASADSPVYAQAPKPFATAGGSFNGSAPQPVPPRFEAPPYNPADWPAVQFEDTMPADSMRYLKPSSSSVRQAVQTSVLLKFPTRHQRRAAKI